MSVANTSKPAIEPVQKRGQKRRQLILAAARAKLIEQGIDGLVLREIAEDMGITHGNLQYYFKTKKDLLKALFDREVQKFTSGLNEAIQSATSINGKISAIVDSGFDQLKSEETKLWRILIAISENDTGFAEILRSENEYYDRTLANELANISPDLTSDRRLQIAKIVRVLLDGIAIEFIYNDPFSPKTSGLKGEVVAVLTHLIAIK